MKNYTDRKWDSLRSLKETIENDKTETIISFNGWQLVTDMYIYGICDRILNRVARNVETVEPKKTKPKKVKERK